MNDILGRSVGNVQAGIKWGLNIQKIGWKVKLIDHSIRINKGFHEKIIINQTVDMKINSQKIHSLLIIKMFNTVQEFKYLDEIIFNEGRTLDIKNRMKKANICDLLYLI